ncbi:hypothetical protein [Sulfurimonas sp.]|uniref:hypothetical protein n=1 Tax=Sulfurimonas sp. TaxID=2022749 RepID=UPI0035667650
MNISQQFSPPFKLIAPFFIVGISVYVASVLSLFSFDIGTLHYLNNLTLAWVHVFLLGFMMMIIFGAMAQLVPVVLEVEHFAIELYYAVYPLLLIGTSLMAVGFYGFPVLLPFGGTIALIAFGIFLFETFLTIKKVKKMSFVIGSMIIANIFLLLGLIVGIVMALGYSGLMDVDLNGLLRSHVYLVLVGYVSITIMGIGLVLIPMFWLSHGFSWKYAKIALLTLSIAVILIFIGSLTCINTLNISAYGLTIISFSLYSYNIYVIYKKRVRVETDIYFKSILFSSISLFIALILGIFYFLTQKQEVLLATFWMVFLGFITHIIIGHLYKIIPFLVWYEKFSPYVGKKQVPMLADMIPVNSANMQFIFSSIGVLCVLISILTGNEVVYKSGLSFLSMGAIFLFKDVLSMISFKGGLDV